MSHRQKACTTERIMDLSNLSRKDLADADKASMNARIRSVKSVLVDHDASEHFAREFVSEMDRVAEVNGKMGSTREHLPVLRVTDRDETACIVASIPLLSRVGIRMPVSGMTSAMTFDVKGTQVELLPIIVVTHDGNKFGVIRRVEH